MKSGPHSIARSLKKRINRSQTVFPTGNSLNLKNFRFPIKNIYRKDSGIGFVNETDFVNKKQLLNMWAH
jgi:hypothetical protein